MSPAVQAFTLALMQSGIDRDTRVYDLTEAEIDALLRPVIEAEREACAVIAESTDTGWADARTFTAQKVAAAIRSQP